MDFTIPEMHNDIKALASDMFADFSSAERLKGLEANGAYFDKEVWGKMVETSLHAASLPEALGGMGLDYLATSMVSEALGQTLVSVPYIPSVVSTALPLASFADNAVVNAALEGVVAGSMLLTAGFIELGNEDAFDPSTTAVVSGATAAISGTKACVPFAHDADKVLISAKAGSELVAALVDLKQSSVSFDEQYATSNEPQAQVNFNNAAADVIATGDKAVALFEQAIAMTTVAYCSMAVGAAAKMTKISCEYTSQREQFGVPIATFQAVAHRLANAYIDTDCLRITALKAAYDVNHGDYDSDVISMAKVWCGDVLHRVSHTAQHVHGGAGIDKDYHLFRYCLWAKQLELSLGSTRVHLAKVADSVEAKYLAQVA